VREFADEQRGMAMSKRALLLAAFILAAGAFGLGYEAGGGGSRTYTMYTGDCYTGIQVTTCMVDGVAWGVSGQVAWTDAANVGRGGGNDPSEWPACLPPTQEAKGVRFAGAWLPVGSSGLSATIVWVDCRG
jgi:hypothetical protein